MNNYNASEIALNAETICAYFKRYPFKKPMKLHLFSCIDSTNQWLKDLPKSNAIEICCAEMQIQGRGRFGRSWVSPYGENIYCSSRWHLDCVLSQLSGLSLVVSLAVYVRLCAWGLGKYLRVKWPNDILWGDKKLCGNLIEVLGDHHDIDVIIGIGINVNTNTEETYQPDLNWCSLYDMLKTPLDRNRLIAEIIIQLNDFIDIFMQKGLDPFMMLWQEVDYLYGRRIRIATPQGIYTGQAEGITSSGQLKIVDEQGSIHFLSSGDASLHGV